MNLQKLYDRSQQYRTILLLLCIFYMMFLAPLQLARVKKEQMFGISLNIGLKKTWVLLVICAAVLLGLRYLMDSNQISFVMSSLATLYSFHKKLGITVLLQQKQAKLLQYYFDFGQSNFTIFHSMESYLQSHYHKYHWMKMYRPSSRTYNYSVLFDDPSLRFGHAIDAGPYPNDISSFIKYYEDIQQIFTFKQRFIHTAQERLHGAVKKYKDRVDIAEWNGTFVGVHIRLTDYARYLDVLYNLTLVDTTYIEKAVTWFKKKHHMPLFVFLSDNIKWVEENFSRSPKLCSQSECTFFGTRRHGVTKDTTFHHGGSEETGKDLATLAACNHTIYTYGTFGMWGALLAGSSPNHEVVIPAGYHTLTRHRIAKANLVGWKVLD